MLGQPPETIFLHGLKPLKTTDCKICRQIIFKLYPPNSICTFLSRLCGKICRLKTGGKMILRKYLTRTSCSYEGHRKTPSKYANDVKEISKNVVDYLRDKGINRITFVYTGHSGAILAHYLLLFCSGSDITCKAERVLKPKEGAHASGHTVFAGDDCIFVDDLIDEGETFEMVRDAVEMDEGKIVAIVLIDVQHGHNFGTEIKKNYDVIGGSNIAFYNLEYIA